MSRATELQAVSSADSSADEIVSSEAEELILVDKQDREIGFRSKARCHDRSGILHRAFSLFVFDREGRVLLQRRAASKRLWPRYWSNSCCSHPRRGELVGEAAHRRLYQELRIRSELEFLYKFEYRASFGSLGSEHELCWVFAGVSDDSVQANGNEVEDWRWISPGDLDRELERHPDRFTPWFRLEWPRVREMIRLPEAGGLATGGAVTP